MRVIIAGAGSVGRSIARELLGNGHQILLIDKNATAARMRRVGDATWLAADACEISVLREARMQDADVVVAATGDDKVNLVVSLLAKSEFRCPRTVARVNNPKNEWLFGGQWGVDVAVSTPRLMTALVEEAVSVGELVRIFEFQQGHATMVEITLPAHNPLVGARIGELALPTDTALVGIIRQQRPLPPDPDDALQAHDELLLLTTAAAETQLEQLLRPGAPPRVRLPQE